MKYKRKLYSFVAVILVLVLSFPTVTNASENIKFTTYECVQDMFTEDTWQDLSIENAYCCPNDLYDTYAPFLESMPINLSSYNYYLVWAKGSTLNVIGIKSSDYCFIYVGNYSYGDFLEVTNQQGYELLKSENASIESDISRGYDIMSYSHLYFCTGTYEEWCVNTTSSGNQWEQRYPTTEIDYVFDNNHKGYTFTGSGMLIATNFDVYSSYEYWSKVPSQNEVFRSTLANCTADYIAEQTQNMTILNTSVKYYDGENINGGAAAYAYDLTFDEFLVEKINHPDLIGEVGAMINYSMGQDLFDEVYGNPAWKLQLNFEITYSVTETDNGLFYGGGNRVEQGILYDSYSVDLDSYITQSGSFMYDFSNLSEQSNLFTYLLLTENVDSGNSILGGKLGQSILNAIDSNFNGSATIGLSSGKYYYVDYLYIKCKGQMFNENDNLFSNSAERTLNIVSGNSTGYVNKYDSETDSSVPGESTSSGNYYDVAIETDSGGNTYYNYYYYDTTNNTVTPSINTGSNQLTLYFATPLTIEGVSSSGGGSSNNTVLGGNGDNINITIEDDDYTDTALREDLKDGFGLFDDSETELKADGYLQMAASFFNNIDPGLGAILAFGISSSVVIGILRVALRR